MGKIKLFLESDKGKDILVVIIVVLVGLGSFELGRLSKNSDNPGIKIECGSLGADGLKSAYKGQIEPLSGSNISQSQGSGNFFASSKGSKYYSISCSAGKTIKQENRIYFNTAVDAEKAGFELSSSCR